MEILFIEAPTVNMKHGCILRPGLFTQRSTGFKFLGDTLYVQTVQTLLLISEFDHLSHLQQLVT